MSEFGAFLKEDAFWSTLRKWHAELEDHRGERAELRRARTPFEVLVTPGFHRGFADKLRRASIHPNEEELALLALPVGLLASVKTFIAKPEFPKQLALSSHGSQEVRDVRFRRLMAVDDRDELFTMLKRLLRLLDDRVNPESLVRGAFYWGERIKRNWALQYYTAS